MTSLVREKLSAFSGDVLAEQVAQLMRLFPEAVSEGKIDWDKLQATLGDSVTTAPERFSFTWSGKSEAIQLLQTPTHATLIPCPQESVDFATTGNVFIEGDNLEVLKLLFKPYFGKVKLIYIDPPYNTGQDFVYPDDYADPLTPYLKLTGQMDAEGNLLTSNPETSGRYHSSWLSMMYPRLFLARQLLRDDGFIAQAVWQKAYTSNMTAKHISDTHDYVVVYARDSETLRVGKLERTKEQLEKFQNPDNDSRGPWKAENLSAGKFYAAGQFSITTPAGKKVTPPAGRYWRCNEATYQKWFQEGRITFGKDGNGRPMLKKYLNEIQQGLTPNTWWTHRECGSNKEASIDLKDLFAGKAVFDTPKPLKLIDRLLRLFADNCSLVLDFFSGPAATAQAVLEANREDGGNRKFIMVQLPEPTQNKEYPTIAEIGKERIRRVLAKLKKEAAESLDLKERAMPEDLGFKVFKLAAPRIQPWTAVEADREPEKYGAKLALYNDALVRGWTAEIVLWEIVLREGLGLNTRFELKKLANGNTIWLVTDPDKDPPQTLIVCLDEKIGIDFSKHVDLNAEQIVVARDLALDDSAAANLALQCRLKTI